MKRTLDRSPIRYSETKTFAMCERAWWFEYHLKLQPKTTKDVITRGTIGHEALNMLRTGKTIEDTLKYVNKATTVASVDIEGLEAAPEAQVGKLPLEIEMFHSHVGYDDYEVVHTESQFAVKLPGVVAPLVLTVDAILRNKRTGDLWLYESKFVGQFRDEDALVVDRQTALYMGAAQANGINVEGVIYDQIREAPAPPNILKPKKEGDIPKISTAANYRDFVYWLHYAMGAATRGEIDPEHMGSVTAQMAEVLPNNNSFKRTLWSARPGEVNFKLAELGKVAQRLVTLRNAAANRGERGIMVDSHIVCNMCRCRELCMSEIQTGRYTDIAESLFEKRTNSPYQSKK